MSTYRKKGRYYTSTDYYSSTAYQEYSGDDYIEPETDYTDEYQDYSDYQDYPDETIGYSEESPEYQSYQNYSNDTYGYDYDQPYQGYSQSDYDYDYNYDQQSQEYSQSDYNYGYGQQYQGYSQADYDYGYDNNYDQQEQNDLPLQPSQTNYQQSYQQYRQYRYTPHNFEQAGRTYQRPGSSYRQQYSSYRYPRYGQNQETQETQEASDSKTDEPVPDNRQTEPDEQELIRRRQVRRHRRMREERRRRRRKRLLIALAVRLGCMLFALTTVILLIRFIFFSSPVKRKVTVEAGTELNVKDFLKKDKVKGTFVTDVSKVSLDHVGEQEIILKVKGKERKSRLIVKDTKSPKADAASVIIDVDGELKAEELVENIKDATDVKCSFKKEPDLSKKGTVSAGVILTDEGGNRTEIVTDIEVIVDKEPPVIDGVAPLTGFIGEPISYKSAITVTDNCVRDMDVTVDNSKVDTKTEGTYDVFYTAVDRAGNKAEASTTITIKEKPENYVTPEEVLEEADEVLKEITTKDMTLKEKARAIYDWARTEIGYVSTSDKDSWTNGAHQGFTEKSGDCFVFYSTSKALLTQAGIPNLDVVKSDTSHSSHYWSLIDCGDGWYHFDTTPRQGGGDDFFMKTDAEILEYSENHRNSHIFDRSLYPATPEEDSTIE